MGDLLRRRIGQVNVGQQVGIRLGAEETGQQRDLRDEPQDRARARQVRPDRAEVQRRAQEARSALQSAPEGDRRLEPIMDTALQDALRRRA